MHGDKPAPTKERTKETLAHHMAGIIVMGKHVKRYGEGMGGVGRMCGCIYIYRRGPDRVTGGVCMFKAS